MPESNSKDCQAEVLDLYAAAMQNDIVEAKRIIESKGQSALMSLDDSLEKMAPVHLAASENSLEFVELCLTLNRVVQSSIRDGIRSLNALHIASMKGKLDVVKLLVENGTDLRGRAGDLDLGALPSHFAAYYGHLETLEYFLSVDKELLNIRDKIGNHLLHWAAAGGNLSVAEYLVAEGADVDVANDASLTPLLLASAVNSYDIVKFLIEKKANLRAKTHDDVEQLAIHLAAHYGHRGIAKLLTTADESLFDVRDANGCRAIHRAVLAGNYNVVARFLLQRVYVDDIGTKFGRTPLHMAAEKGFSDIVRLLMENKANPYARSSNEDLRQLPIDLAAYNGHVNVVEYFVTSKPNLINSKNIHGDRPIHIACLRGKLNVVEFLLKHEKDQLEIRNNYGRAPLHSACQEGQLEIVKFLIDHGAKVDSQTDRSDDRRTPIHFAGSRGHAKVVEYLLQTNSSLIKIEDRRGMSVIHRAALNGRIEVVELLLRRRIKLLNWRDSIISRAPLHYAAQEGKLDLVKMLANRGAQLDIQSDGENDDALLPIHLAAHSGHVDVVDFFLSRMPELIEAMDLLSNTPMHSAALGGENDVIDYLVKVKNVDINLVDQLGRTALHLAAEKGEAKTVKFLLENDADPEKKSNDKDLAQLAVHMAAFYGHPGVLEVFRTFRPDLLASAKDAHGNRPIHSATLAGKITVVEWLLQQPGVDASVQDDRFGRTPLHCAAEQGHTVIAKALVSKHGADIHARTNPRDNELTALHLAAFNGRIAVAQYLGKHEPRLLVARDAHGATPLEWVRRENSRRNADDAMVLEQWLINSKRQYSENSKIRRSCKVS